MSVAQLLARGRHNGTARTHHPLNPAILFSGGGRGGKVRAYSDVGCYPIFYVTSDSGVLCADCVHDNRKQCADTRERSSGWFVVAHDANWEDPDLRCCNCGERIESAYAEDESGSGDES